MAGLNFAPCLFADRDLCALVIDKANHVRNFEVHVGDHLSYL